MKRFEITKEMLEKANDYMPIAIKREVSLQIAKKVCEKMKIAEQNKEANKMFTMPEIKKENPILKAILLLNTLLGFYFDIDVLKEVEEQTGKKGYSAEECYDYFAKEHPFSQIEKFKADVETREKAFNVLTDFKEFKKMVDCEIFAILRNENDGLERFTAMTQLFSNPENLKALTKELVDTANLYSAKLKSLKIADFKGEKTEKADKKSKE